MTRHTRQVSLASSYAPVLIERDRTHPLPNVSPSPPATTLKYPYPLIALGLADIAYTIHAYHTSSSTIPLHLLTLSSLRAAVLCIPLGLSASWRSRGGWVGSISVISLGSVVWEGCKGQLLRRVDDKLDTAVLVVTALLAIIEFLSFMLLLRLSPPAAHRPHPFSLRIPPSAVQSPTAFMYSEQAADLTSPTPWRPRYDDTRDGSSDMESESVSSISESSIIDLPPPLEPNRLLPPSVSLNTGLSLAALDESPIIGPLVRRTRSARFSTIRSLGRMGSAGSEQEQEQGQEASSGYGTFSQGQVPSEV